MANCLLCAGDLRLPQVPSQALCDVCRALVYPGGPPAVAGLCTICHQPLLGELSQCVDCAAHPWSFSHIDGLFAFHSRSAELLRAYKSRSQVALAHHWASQLSARMDEQGPIVPVPSHREHLRERGWDPVSHLCQALRKQTGFTVLPALKRLSTSSQKRLNRAQRAINAESSYTFNGPCPGVSGQLVWLVDDVVTTGWTVEACARLLRSAGAREVRVLCLCVH